MCREWSAGKHENIKELTNPLKCGKFKILWKDTIKRKGMLSEPIKFRDCQLPFDPESFILLFFIYKYKSRYIEKNNFVRCFICVRNLISHIKGRTYWVMGF
jgi:hypothetical protein